MTPLFPLGPASGPFLSPKSTPGAWINVCTPTLRCSRAGTFCSGKVSAWVGNISVGTWMPGINQRRREAGKRECELRDAIAYFANEMTMARIAKI
jgi:hypothetical protein